MADPTLDPTNPQIDTAQILQLMAPGMVGPDGRIDMQALQRQRFFDQLGAFGASMLQSGRPSAVPIGFGEALGYGLDAARKAAPDTTKQALTMAEIIKYAQEAKASQAKIAADKALLDEVTKPEPPLRSRPGSAGVSMLSPPPAPDAPPGAPLPKRDAAEVDQYTGTWTPGMRALARGVAIPESGGKFNARWPGKTFDDYSQHPNILEPGPSGPSSAAGAFGFTGSTYRDVAGDLPDFTPQSQVIAFDRLAKSEYARKTGRDLEADLAAGDTSRVVGALRGRWPTIGNAMMYYPKLLSQYTQGGTNVAGGGSGADDAGSTSRLPQLPDTSLDGAGSGGGPVPRIRSVADTSLPTPFVGGLPPVDAGPGQPAAQGEGDQAGRYVPRPGQSSFAIGPPLPPLPLSDRAWQGSPRGQPEGTRYNSRGEPYSPDLLTMSPDEKARALLSERQLKAGTFWGPQAEKTGHMAELPAEGAPAAPMGMAGASLVAPPGAPGTGAAPDAPPGIPGYTGGGGNFGGGQDPQARQQMQAQAAPQRELSAQTPAPGATIEEWADRIARAKKLDALYRASGRTPPADISELATMDIKDAQKAMEAQRAYEYAGPTAAARAQAEAPFKRQEEEDKKKLELLYGPQIAAATEVARRTAGMPLLTQEEQIKYDFAVKQADANKGMRTNAQGVVEPRPGYGEATAAIEGPKAGAVAQAQLPAELQKIQEKARLDYVQQLANNGMRLRPDGSVERIPEWSPIAAGNAGEKAGAEAAAKLPSELQQKQFEADQRIREQVAQTYGNRVADDLFDRKKSAYAAAQSMESLYEARRLLDSGIITGPLANWKLKFDKLLGERGLAPNTETFLATQKRQAIAMVKQLGTNPTDTDREYVDNIAAGRITLNEKSIRDIMDLNERLSRNLINHYNADASRVQLPPNVAPYPLTVDIPEPRTATAAPAAGAPALQPGESRTFDTGTLKRH